jgi:hypothetical protein
MGTNGNVNYSARSGNGWAVGIEHRDGNPVTLGVYVICLRNAPASTRVTERSAAGTLSPTAEGGAIAQCKSGEVVVGGGFSGHSILVNFTGPSTDPPTSWEVQAYNASSSDSMFSAYAECLSGPSASSSLSEVSWIFVPIAGHVTARASCPIGFLAGGGFRFYLSFVIQPTDDTWVDDSYPANGSTITWEAYAYNPSAASYLFRSLALCLTFI